MMPDRARIEALVPHAGSMCLLDAVLEWDDVHIVCRAPEPDAAHPLARAGSVPAIAAAEYAAQATAVHGALLGDATAPRAGVLAKLMEVQLHGSCFAAGGGALTVRADLLGRLDRACLYAFQVAGAAQPMASGRLLVAFPPVVAA